MLSRLLITVAAASVLALAGCSSGGDSSTPYVAPPPGTPMTVEANLSWTLQSSFVDLPSGKQCVLTLTVHNTGDLTSGTITAAARSRWSTNPGTIPWSTKMDLVWQETGATISVVPGHSSLTAKYSFNMDNNNQFVASVWVSPFGWITHETDEGGGQWSQQFFYVLNANG
jgi:hypothetical protein